MQPRTKKFFTLFSKAGSNVVESAAILMEFVAAPHERWAELAKRVHDTEHTVRRHHEKERRCRSRVARRVEWRRANRPLCPSLRWK
jgi:hypothetical protein